MSETEREEVLTASEVAQLLGFHQVTLYSWARRGKIPNYKIGSAIRFRKSELERWLQERRRG